MLHQKPIAVAGILCVLGLTTAMFGIASSAMLGGLYQCGWPIFLSYLLLYWAAVALPVRLGVNKRFGVALGLTIGFKFWFLFYAGATITFGQDVLVARGIPTGIGGVVQTSVCLAMVIFATGLAGLVRQVARAIGGASGLFDAFESGAEGGRAKDHRSGIREPRSLL